MQPRAWERGCVSSGVLVQMEKIGERRSAGASLYIVSPGIRTSCAVSSLLVNGLCLRHVFSQLSTFHDFLHPF